MGARKNRNTRQAGCVRGNHAVGQVDHRSQLQKIRRAAQRSSGALLGAAGHQSGEDSLQDKRGVAQHGRRSLPPGRMPHRPRRNPIRHRPIPQPVRQHGTCCNRRRVRQLGKTSAAGWYYRKRTRRAGYDRLYGSRRRSSSGRCSDRMELRREPQSIRPEEPRPQYNAPQKPRSTAAAGRVAGACAGNGREEVTFGGTVPYRQSSHSRLLYRRGLSQA